MKRKIRLLGICLILSISLALAQTRKITGWVVDQNGEPLVGASVIVKGTTQGVSTDANGRYSLVVSEKGGTLIVSLVGSLAREVTIANNLKVVLENDDKRLDEVIVVAYGTTKRSSFTGSASSLNSKDIAKRSITTASSAIEGNASGVQVTSASGQPGSDASIRIRGFGSVNAANSPIYVVDGILFNGRLSDINPADIESITVLKDGAATALYGSSAGNGVLLITTKRGTNLAGVSLNISQGWSKRAYKDYDRVNVWEYYPLQWKMLKNAYVTAGKDEATAAQLATGLSSVNGSDGIYDKLKYNPFSGVSNDAIVGTDGVLNADATSLKWGDDMDWANEAFGVGHRQEYTLSYNTKSDKSDTYASLSYLNDEGYMLKTDYERYSGRINYNINPVKWFKSGINLNLGRITSNYSSSTSSSSSSYSNLTRFVRYMAPIYPIHKHDLSTGEYVNSAGVATTDPSQYVYDYDGTRQSDPGRDALVETLWNSREYNRNNTSGRTYATISPLKGFDITVNYGLDLSEYRGKVYENSEVGDGTAGPGRLAITSTRSTTQTLNELISYNKKIREHSFDALVGHESYKYEYNYLYSMKVGETFSGFYEFSNFATVSSVNSYTDNYTKEGYLGRLNYDYNNKYYASFSFRSDGSSRLAKDTRWGTFWSFGASWRIDQEKFMKNISWVNSLKIRSSYGETGNDMILDSDGDPNYYAYQTQYSLGLNNGTEAGVYFTSLANKDLKWETQVSKDVALEFALFNKLSGSLEYFIKGSRDLLFDVSTPTSTGVSSLTKNIGNVKNKGVEIELNYNILKRKDWSASVGANATFLTSKITKLPEENRTNGIISGTKKYLEGHSIYDFWLRQWYGVDSDTGNGLFYLDTSTYDPTSESLSSTVKSTIVTGANGEVLTNSYLYAKYDYSGSSIPKVYGGFNLNVAYKGFDLTALFSYSLGGKVYDTNYASLMSNSSYGAAMHSDLKKAWQQAGDITDVPRLDNNSTHATSIGAASSRWLVSSDYLNFRSLTFGYTLPSELLKSAQLKMVRLSLNTENLFMLKARQGLNPQANYGGLTYNEYMPAKTVTFGINVSF
ncbi:MAG: collagen-binding protein [Bacteroidetes bacterium]|nr:collagen-binding protein [Bacteroidota bacterium]